MTAVAIIDYEAGNQTSVQRALAALGVQAEVTRDPERIATADRVIFPGVGAAGSCMANLARLGVGQALREAIASGRPVLGICVGMQLLFDSSEEDGGTACLGLIAGQVTRFAEQPGLKIPHMGWNPVRFAPGELLGADIPLGSAFYFVHSYRCQPAAEQLTIATSDHGGEFCAGIRRDNLVAVQFHPEKSGRIGLQLLRNFLS